MTNLDIFKKVTVPGFLGYVDTGLPLAELFLERALAYSGQRNLTPGHVRKLCNEMKESRFEPRSSPGITSVYVKPTQEIFVVNGMHTCQTIVKTGVSQKLVIQCHEVQDMEEAARIYGAFDGNKVRNNGDAVLAYVGKEKVKSLSLLKVNLNAIPTAVRFMYNNFKIASCGVSKIESVELFKAWESEALQYFKILQYCKKELTKIEYQDKYLDIRKRALERLQVYSIVSAGIFLLRFAIKPESVIEFFSSIVLCKHSRGIFRHLREWLFANVVNRGGQPTTSHQEFADVFTKKIAATWNFFQKDSTGVSLDIWERSTIGMSLNLETFETCKKIVRNS